MTHVPLIPTYLGLWIWLILLVRFWNWNRAAFDSVYAGSHQLILAFFCWIRRRSVIIGLSSNISRWKIKAPGDVPRDREIAHLVTWVAVERALSISCSASWMVLGCLSLIYVLNILTTVWCKRSHTAFACGLYTVVGRLGYRISLVILQTPSQWIRLQCHGCIWDKAHMSKIVGIVS